MQLNFNISFSDLYVRDGLIKLDETFLHYIKLYDKNLFFSLIEARERTVSILTSSHCENSISTKCNQMLSQHCSISSRYLTSESKVQSSTSINQITDSQLIIDTSYLLNEFIAKLFNIEKEIKKLTKEHNKFALIYKCKRLFVQRYALRKYTDVVNIDIDHVTNKLSHFLTLPTTEIKFARQVMRWFESKEHYKEEIELAAQYAVWRVKNNQSMLFSIHEKIDYENLVSFSKKEVDGIEILYSKKVKRRYGFDLTSEKVNLNKALDNAHYCIFCHKQNKDSCSKGLQQLSIKRIANTGNQEGYINSKVIFPQSSQVFRKSPLEIELHGCPLGLKISEMNLVKSEGYSIASLAIVMIDNPLCAATGYRICNDCMNSCIYQKQKPVNIPMIETRVLNDVLSLPYGFEIYSLLSRWNPLNFQRPLPKENTGKNVLIVGLGPAGFNLAHHLLNDGHNVVAIDGLKIEPLIDNLEPIKHFKCDEKLSKRTIDGFGGVAEYGITSRWNKNYLKSIRILLERRKNFTLYGGIRFGSTVTVSDAFNLGFDHIALALGSGNPKIIKIKNMLARGVRMASDFLMSLQLNGAFKYDSVTNLQIRMPIVVIGGGLTAIDTATEALAYYPIQVEKFFLRYKLLISKYGKDYVEKDWTEEEREIANEFIFHAQLIQREKELGKSEKREAKILELMQSLGGVKVIYRKELKNAPSYRLNSDEVQNALSEGVYFIENLKPIEIMIDKYNHAESIKFTDTKSGKIRCIKARSIFIASGTEPNTVIATEDTKHFKLSNGYFVHLNSSGDEIDPVFSPKMENKDRILVYKEGNKAISFFGDLHPSYSGSVVKAMVSAKNGYPIISQLLKEIVKTTNKSQLYTGMIPGYLTSKEDFFNKIKEQFTAKVVKVQYLTHKVVEIIIKAPLAAKNFKPGQFFRLQNFEANNRKTRNLVMEGVAATGASVNRKKGIIYIIVLETGGSTNLCRYIKEGEEIVLMGPTGCPSSI
ncbi:MAG: FAD-dependent oxidoreductase [Wolbachia endosymbiont of Meromenopon meropis]|nr:FAD-dependent oxidoreductase [Wolbachia endosymbiont of Meromenopon meropis]